MGKLQVEFELTGAGWMDIRLARGESRYHLVGLSYLSAVLDDVVAMAIGALIDRDGEAVFDLEPGRQRLAYLRTYDPDAERWRSTLRVGSSDTDFGEPMPQSWSEDWSVELADADEFAAGVLEGANVLLERHGYDGYFAEWVESPFPVRGIAALSAALAVQPLPGRQDL